MVPKFFGQYLLEREILTSRQLVEAINYQRSKVLKLGEIALSKGFLTEKDVAKIHNEQKRTDMMFGELAVRMKMLTEEQLQEILTIQQNSHIYLGEAIVARGFLTLEELEKYLEGFKKEQILVPPIEVMIAEEIENKETMTVTVDMTCKMLRRIGDMLSKTGQLRYEDKAAKNLGVIATLDFKGDVSSRYMLNCSWNVAHQVARKTFKNEELPFDMELIADTIGEFVNVTCGNVRAKMLELGKRLEIEPPSTHMDSRTPEMALDKKEQAVIVPVYTPIGELEVALIERK
ncbi:MAG: chemotaxis protein CheX [bacterium]